MTGTKQILIAGFSALCMVLPACRTTTDNKAVEAPPLIHATIPLTTAAYTAEYTQDGALPFICEVKLATDGRVRRDYVWKDEKGADKKVSIVIDGKDAVRIEDGKPVPGKELDTLQARFFASLVLNPGSVVSNASGSKKNGTSSALEKEAVVPFHAYSLELAGIPGIESCTVATDPKSDRWSGLVVRMSDDPGTVFSTGFHDYKLESGVTYPSRIVSSTEGGAPVTCTIRDVKINPELPGELFLLPDTNG